MIGKLALNYKKITNEQYIRSLAIQEKEKESGREANLDEILLTYNFLTPGDMSFLSSALDILTQKRKEKRFGAIAVRQGLLTKEELLKAVEIQKTEGGKIGTVLKNSGALTEKQCDEIITIQKSIVVRLPSENEIANGVPASENTGAVILSTVEINVAEDGLAAVAILPEDGRMVDHIEIRKALKDNDICFGEIPDYEIKENLKLFDLGLTSFVVAKGLKSAPGNPGELTLNFIPRETEPGMIDDQGKMIFNRRGELPFVNEGDLIAERNDLISSIPGRTVFGKVIEVEDVEDGDYECGNGACIDETGRKILADYSGEPCLNLDGTLSVLKETIVDTVDGETGHRVCDGNIVVRGTIQSGSEVSGKNIEALEILGAKITSDGDIDVEQGITGARIRANGNIRAAFIKNCHIVCAGEVIIEKEIIDSEIVVGGCCFVKGAILSSTICSGNSIGAVTIASGSGGPSSLEIGMGKKVGKRLTEKLEKTVYIKGKEIAHLLDERDDMMTMISITDSVTKGMVNSRKKREEELSAIKSLVEKMEKKTNKTVETGRQRIKEFQEEIRLEAETTERLIKDKKQVRGKLAELDKEIKIKTNETERCHQKMYTLIDMVRLNVRKARVRVVEQIAEGTTIVCPDDVLVLERDFSDVTLCEVESVIPDSDGRVVKKLDITGRRLKNVSG